MKATISCITLAVDDLKKSVAFYRDGLGLPVGEVADDADHVPIELPGGLYLVLSLRPEFGSFIEPAGLAAAPRGSSECILSYFAASKAEVDGILKRAQAAGGAVPGAPDDKPWGYAGLVKDPDGHLWEVMWNANLNVG